MSHLSSPRGAGSFLKLVTGSICVGGGCHIVFGKDLHFFNQVTWLTKQRVVGFRCDADDRYPCPLCPRDILITSVDAMTTFNDLCEEVRDMCGLHQQHPLTLKWVDSEGSPSLPRLGSLPQVQLNSLEPAIPQYSGCKWVNRI